MNSNVLLFVKGDCIEDKLNAALAYLNSRLMNITKLMNQFESCKKSLMKEMTMGDGNNNHVERALPNYEQCVISRDCKLAEWKSHLEMKKVLIKKELRIQSEGWWTGSVCKFNITIQNVLFLVGLA